MLEFCQVCRQWTLWTCSKLLVETHIRCHIRTNPPLWSSNELKKIIYVAVWNCPFFWGRLSVFANITSLLPLRKSVTVDMWHNFDFGLCCRHHQRSVSLHAHKDYSSDCLTPLVLQFSWKGQVVKVIVLNRYRSSFLLFPLMPFQAWEGEEDNGEPLKVQ